MGLILVREKHPQFSFHKGSLLDGERLSLSLKAGSLDTMSLKAAWEEREDPVAACLVTQTDLL